MPPYDFIQAPFESIHLQWTTDARHLRNVVQRSLGLNLIDEPQPLLGERSRRGFAASLSLHRGRSQQASLRPPRRFDKRCKARQRGFFEHRSKRHLHAESLSHARNNLHTQERIPTELEKAILTSGLLDPQQGSPDTAKDFFARGSRF